MLDLSAIELLLQESLKDTFKQTHPSKDNKSHVVAGIDWLSRAQDKSGDNGVSAWYSLVNGWQPSYIETTGYIINTFLDASVYLKKPSLLRRAIKMADFLVGMQHELGGYRTSVPSRGVDSAPTVFNTSQDLLGLTDIYELTKKKKYLDSVILASDFLLSIQEPDGSWLKYTYGSMKHTYHTRVAWGILKVWKLTKKRMYYLAAIRNLEWAAKQQLANGWFQQNRLPNPDPEVPYTHTIAYAIEGFLWSGLLLKNKEYLEIAAKGALPIANYYLTHHFLPGTFDKNWVSKDNYTCLTGDAQLALMWLELFKYNGNPIFFNAAYQMLEFLKSTQSTESISPDSIRGAIKGSYPIYGDLPKNLGYCRYAYLNWSTKFFLDALIVEDQIIASLKK